MENKKLEEARKKAEELAKKAPTGSCIETNKKLIKELKAADIEAELTNLPKQNHIVTVIRIGQEYVLDPLLTKDYGVGDGKVIFTKEEHKKLVKKAAKKSPFNLYMDSNEVIYKKMEDH